jgi:hypothetical protein
MSHVVSRSSCMLCCAALSCAALHGTGHRFISSNQLFEGAPAALPFQEHFTRQVTTAGTATHSGHVGISHSDADLASKPHKFGLDLSVINEAEPATAAAAAAEAAASAAATAGMHAGTAADAVAHSMHDAQLQRHGSFAGQSSHMAGSSRHSTGGQFGWHICPEEMQMFMNAAARQMHTEQQAGAAGNPLEQQQQQRRLSFEQQMYMQGHAAAPGMLADGSSVARKLVRPSLCSDAGTGSPQAQAAPPAAAGAAAHASPGFSGALHTMRPATDLQAGQQYTLHHIKQEPQDAPYDGAGQSCMRAGYAGTSDGARTVGRRFVLDLSDDGLLY